MSRVDVATGGLWTAGFFSLARILRKPVTPVSPVEGAAPHGIDDLYRVNRADVDYVVVEYKYGSSALGNTLDGRQMSDSWLLGSRTGFDRVQNAVGDLSAVDDIQRALASNRVERWIVHTDHHGGVSVGLLDRYGRFIPRPDMISKILGK